MLEEKKEIVKIDIEDLEEESLEVSEEEDSESYEEESDSEKTSDGYEHSDSSEKEEDAYSFSAELSKPQIEEGLWQRNDTIRWVIGNICKSDLDPDEKRDKTGIALDEYKESIMSFLGENGFEKSY
tara:strand:+ start:1358 stop:1735 length:378 start_codon:yes stop_codon:yes gene_type:complete